MIMSRMAKICVRHHARDSHIQIPYIQRVLLDELAAGLDLVAHQDPEEIVRGAGVFHLYLK
jgi:hypothetical protein